MRFGLRWLQEYVDIDIPPSKIRDLLDLSGTKVESVRRLGRGIEGVVVAEVLQIVPHPNADNLTLVDVRVGDAEQRVVCGARNFAVGDRVPLARVGARLPEMEITARKIRGETSEGMLCSAAELGLSKDHSGILVLPPDSPLGEDVPTVLAMDDTIFELEITPNRPDCMGVIGIAREIAALTGQDLRLPELGAGSADGDHRVTVEIQDPEGCPRYVARFVDGVQPASSPAWMATRLIAAGLRPISAIVDVTNYVLLETGHPLHAFDAAKIPGGKIVVRRARRGEALITIDGVHRELDAADLVIADHHDAIAIAGVMGGAGSEVSDTTGQVILESAYFDPAAIALTSRRHVLRTEASARFERGADPEVLRFAASRAVGLMESVTGASGREEVDVYPEPIRRRVVTLRPRRTDELLGVATPHEEQARFLTSVGFGVAPDGGDLRVEVPGFRPDVEREVDLIEEVARLAGFERLPSTLPPGVAGGLEHDQRADRSLRLVLAALGLHEAWTGSFSSERDLDMLGLAAEHPARRAVRLANPMSDEEDQLRTSLLPGLLRAAARNASFHARGAALFEVSRLYEPTTAQLPREAIVLGAVFFGARRAPSWTGDPGPWDFFGAKGILETALRHIGAPPLRFTALSGPPFHPTRAASVALSRTEGGPVPVGALGEIHPHVCRRFELPDGVVTFEVALQPVFASLSGRPRVAELPRFPSVYIDVAVIVDEGVEAERVGSVIAAAGAPEVVETRLFDVYRGDQVGPGKKSLAYALELRAPDRTLTDQEASAVRDRLLVALQERTGAILRA